MQTMAQYSDRKYTFIKTDNLLDWHKEALSRIHVYEMNGPSTVLFFNLAGELIPDHQNSTFSIPIQYFTPKNERMLREFLSDQKNKGRLSDSDDEKGREKTISNLITKAREHLSNTRNKDFLYQPTPQEERQIARIFVEINKYPEISSVVTKGTELLWLVAQPGKHISTASLLSTADNNHGGYYYPWDPKVIVVGDSPQRTTSGTQTAFPTRFAVAEETIHALDFLQDISNQTLQVNEADIQAALTHADKLEDLFKRVEHEKYDGTENANTRFTYKFTDKEREKIDNYTDRIQASMQAVRKIGRVEPEGLRSLDLWHRTLHIKESDIASLRNCADFRTRKAYENLPWRNVQTEFFTQNAVDVVLRRHFHQYSDPLAEAKYEDVIYDTPYLKKILGYLKELKNNYNQIYSFEDREKASSSVTNIATALERERPGITFYCFKDYRKLTENIRT
jgi:hypothetical protein